MEFTEEDRLFLESHNVCKFDYKDHRFYSCRECDSLIDCMGKSVGRGGRIRNVL